MANIESQNAREGTRSLRSIGHGTGQDFENFDHTALKNFNHDAKPLLFMEINIM